MVGPAKDRLNAPAWDGGSPFFEDWYLKANLLDQEASVWVRYTLRAPVDQAAEATVWAIVDLPKDTIAATRTVEADELELEGDPFAFSTPHGDLTSAACGGDVGPMRWELAWEPTPYAFWGLPRWGYELPAAVTKTVTPNPDLSVVGHVEVADRTLSLDGAPGQQGHVWGRKHADGWAWAHSNAGEGPVWEVLAARSEVLGRSTPSVSTVLLRRAERTLAFRNVLVNQASFGAEGLSFTARSLKHRVRGRVTPGGLHRVTYVDPDGQRAFCHNTKQATSWLVLEERGLTGWREVDRWEDRAGTTAFEVGLREPIGDAEVVLDAG